MNRKRFLLLFFFLGVFGYVKSQQVDPNLKTKGYFSISHPLLSSDANGITYNFDHQYTVSFPMGINILKSKTIGYSFEFSPTIKTLNGVTKETNFLFHPGIIFRRPNNFNFLTRAAFETSGRFGYTFVFNKVYYNTNDYSYWVSIPVPFRFGNNAPASVGLGLQFGFTF
jgi:hypothetical protein